MSTYSTAVKPILSTFKGAKGGILGGAAMGGGAGAVYGGISDNHTALGMGVAGAIAGGFGGREYKAFKGYQGAINSKIMARNGLRKNLANIDSSRMYKGDKATLSGMDGARSYASKRMNSIFA